MASRDNRSLYRPDIDGLRAIAVLSVLFFHGFPNALPGGFVGVDIFFVISGYLISGIILRDLAAGRFSFRRFYVRRARRIFPALFLVLAASLAIGWWGLLPSYFRQLGAHVAGGAGFISNFLLWSEAGYFDTAAELKPLLHLWSLGVEEQYYVLWPLALYVLRKHMHRIFMLTLVVGVSSFAVNLITTIRYPDLAFYWPIPRAWELMIGGIIAYAETVGLRRTGSDRGASEPILVSSVQRNTAATVGIALLAAALLTIDRNNPFPGWRALLPTLGAASLICAGPHAWVNRHLLSNRVAVYVGLISFPLYLWHWPLLAYARVFNADNTPSVEVRLALLAISIALAVMTYEGVEKKVQHTRSRVRWYGAVPTLAYSLAALGFCGALAALNISQSRSAAVPKLAAVSDAFDDWEYGGDRLIAGDSRRTVLFIGDSHMQQYLPRIEMIMRDGRAPVYSVLFETHEGCAPILGIERRGKHCAQFTRQAFRSAHEPNVGTVIVGASWVGFMSRTDYFRAGEPGGTPLKLGAPETLWVLDSLERELGSLVSEGKRVVLVLSSPRGEEFSPRKMVRRDGLDLSLAVVPSVSRATIEAVNNIVDPYLVSMAARIGAETVSPMDVFCSVTTCPTIDASGKPLMRDESHLRTSIVRERFSLLDRFVYLEHPHRDKRLAANRQVLPSVHIKPAAPAGDDG